MKNKAYVKHMPKWFVDGCLLKDGLLSGFHQEAVLTTFVTF